MSTPFRIPSVLGMDPTHQGGNAMRNEDQPERFETVIVGGGQAGLTAGYHLAKRGRPFVILDGNERVGDAWRKRWDSLRLFSPAHFSRLPGKRLPMTNWSFATKDEMADYLEDYAEQFELPVRTGVRVDGLTKIDGGFEVSAGDLRFQAENVVVATGAHQISKVPVFASELDPRIVQMHSSDYVSPSQLQEGDVLVVGAGNSGAEIGLELSRTHRVLLSGPSTGQIPVRHGTLPARLGFRVFRFLGHRVLRVDTRIGRKLGLKLLASGDPLIRTKLKDLLAAGVERVPRVVGMRDGVPVLEDDRVAEVANVVWCTGFRTDFDWIDLPVFGDDGQPKHSRGAVESEAGLYFLGLVFQYSISSDVLPGRGRDAEYIARHIASRSARTSVASGRPVLAGA
jgi:putative flavoprotein involved in K+ transport